MNIIGINSSGFHESSVCLVQDGRVVFACAEERISRVKQDKYKAAYLTFSRLKKKSRRKTKKLCRSLLKYLDRLLMQIATLKEKHPSLKLKNKEQNRLETIEKIKKQQWLHYFGGQSHVPERIVSLHKPYIRAIVRGKETKPVEPAYRQAGLELR